MTLEQIALASLIVEGLFVPGFGALIAILWKMERRLYRVELRLGIMD